MKLNQNLSEQPENALRQTLSSDNVTLPMNLQQAIEKYLDEIEIPLRDSLAPAAKERVRAELRNHLEEMVLAYQELGDSPEIALRNALAQFGKSREIASEFQAQVSEKRPLTLRSLLSSIPRTVGVVWLSLLPLFGVLAYGPAVRSMILTNQVLSRAQLVYIEALTVIVTLFLIPSTMIGWDLTKRKLSHPALHTMLSALVALTPVMIYEHIRSIEPMPMEVMGSKFVLFFIWGTVSSLTVRYLTKKPRNRLFSVSACAD